MPDTLANYNKAKARYDQKQSEKGPTIDKRLQAIDDSIVSSGFQAKLEEIQAQEALNREKAGLQAQSDELLKQEALKRMEEDLKKRQTGQR
jgi:hypothetical protein